MIQIEISSVTNARAQSVPAQLPVSFQESTLYSRSLSLLEMPAMLAGETSGYQIIRLWPISLEAHQHWIDARCESLHQYTP